jgi:transglutaminase-like putative cysteine protease
MRGNLRRKKRFLFTLTCGALFGLLVVAGLSCAGRIIYPESPVSQWLPATESEFEFYVRPNCQAVAQTLQSIVGDPPYTLSQRGFDDIRDWVAHSIAYRSDEERWGKDYWQTPEETLAYRTGDCEDYSILLCSLLRAYGIDAQRVYVALGVDGQDDGHAFVMEDWYYDGEWRRVESQAPARLSSYSRLFFSVSQLDSGLNKYEITVVFNDLYCYDQPLPYNGTQEDSSPLAKMVTAIGDVLRRLLGLLGYAFGLLSN